MTEPELACHVELYLEDATRLWGWMCWTHGSDFGGYHTLNEAETASEGCGQFAPRPRPYVIINLPEEDQP